MRRRYPKAAPLGTKRAKIDPTVDSKRIENIDDIELYTNADLTVPALNKKLACLPQSDPSLLGLLLTGADVYTMQSLTPGDLAIAVLDHLYRRREEIGQNDLLEEPVRDQGFTSCKVVVLMPYKIQAREFIEALIDSHCKNRRKRLYKQSREKYEEEFGDPEELVNDDRFRLGIQIKPKKHAFLYTPFKYSDIIIASPVSLAEALGNEDGFLSSVEVIAMLDTDVFQLQNWDHVVTCLSHMNRLPPHPYVEADYNRVKEPFLDAQGDTLRQTIVASAFKTPTINALVGKLSNVKGIIEEVPHYDGILANEKQQRFLKIPKDTITASAERRFTYFTKELWPKEPQNSTQSIIFCSSYYDYVRLRNFFRRNYPDVWCLSEYTKKSKVQSCTANYLSGKAPTLLITERLVMLLKYKVTVSNKVYFYSLPDNAEVYDHLLESLAENGVATT